MQKNLFVLMAGLLLATTLTITACGNEGGDTATEETEAAAEQGPEYTSAYICPMHCEGSGSDEPGKCPVCGMDYVANDGQEEAGGSEHPEHPSEDDHSGHNH